MFKTKIAKKAANQIRSASKDVLNDLENGDVQQEPAFTDRLLGSIATRLNNKKFSGVHWRASTLTDRGRGSAESLIGADFLSAVTFDLDGYKVSKGFLAQAKIVEPDQSWSGDEKLRQQCEKMLQLSSEAFVFIYSRQSGVIVVPAVEILGARKCNPHELTSKSIAQFYQEHFECFIGDRSLSSSGTDAIEKLKEKARAVLLLRASSHEVDLTED